MDTKGRFGGFFRIARTQIAANLHPATASGKITLAAIGAGALTLTLVGFFVFETRVPTVSADNVQTSVDVLNTPPTWTVDAQESTESSTSTPTNSGSSISWVATAADSGLDNYYLLICKTSAAPTANVSAAPVCGGGLSNQWAVSAATTQGTQATAATTTKDTYPFLNESNDWFAWICDGNSSLPLCNATYKQGSGTTASPFVIDHPPVFTAVSNNSPQDPGGTLTWTITATSTDLLRGGDTVKVSICGSGGFSAGACLGTTYATSSFVTHNPTATYNVPIPKQDATYSAYAYVTNNFNLEATSTYEATSTNVTFVINNVAPTVSAATVTLVDPVHSSTTLVLANPATSTGPYWVQFQVSDNNSCQNISSGNEIASAVADVYSPAISSTSCRVAGDFNSNNCYPSASPNSYFSCSQDAGSCSGATSVTATWTCRFYLWYNADPSDTGSKYPGQNWLASVQVTDDNGAASALTEATTGGKELTSFLAFDVPETSIAYGGLQPGQQTDPLDPTTTLKELGNVGLDESLYGETMCPGWSSSPNQNYCDSHNGNDPTRDITVDNQKTGTSSVAYASPYSYALSGSTTPISVAIHVPKTTSTSSPQYKLNYWGILVPSAITISGNYFGQDTITAVESAAANW